MQNLSDVFPVGAPVEIILEGGPADIPTEMRVRRAAPADLKIKLLHRGGYEHFEPTGDASGGSAPMTFRWTMRTEIAE